MSLEMADNPAAVLEPVEPVEPVEAAAAGEPEESAVEDVLVEEVSIDGMCGVY